jgi:chromosome segregation ATPase
MLYCLGGACQVQVAIQAACLESAEQWHQCSVAKAAALQELQVQHGQRSNDLKNLKESHAELAAGHEILQAEVQQERQAASAAAAAKEQDIEAVETELAGLYEELKAANAEKSALHEAVTGLRSRCGSRSQSCCMHAGTLHALKCQ